MSEKLRLYRKIGFQNMSYTKYINVIINSIGPSIINLRSIYCCLHSCFCIIEFIKVFRKKRLNAQQSCTFSLFSLTY